MYTKFTSFVRKHLVSEETQVGGATLAFIGKGIDTGLILDRPSWFFPHCLVLTFMPQVPALSTSLLVRSWKSQVADRSA